jgi:hypothetical protein
VTSQFSFLRDFPGDCVLTCFDLRQYCIRPVSWGEFLSSQDNVGIRAALHMSELSYSLRLNTFLFSLYLLHSLRVLFLHSYFLVGFEVLTAVSTKMAVFWVVAPCSLVEVYQRFRGPCCLHHQGSPWLPDYTALQPRRQSSSYFLFSSFATIFAFLYLFVYSFLSFLESFFNHNSS